LTSVFRPVPTRVLGATAITLYAKASSAKTGESIVKRLVTDQVENNRYYLRSIAEVIQFLVVNELPLRGDSERFDSEGSGLFQNLFMYTLSKDSRLCNIYKTIPANATCTSPDTQNEIISAMADLTVEEIVRQVNTSPKQKQSKAKQRCVMGVGMCLYAQLVQTNNT